MKAVREILDVIGMIAILPGVFLVAAGALWITVCLAAFDHEHRNKKGKMK